MWQERKLVNYLITSNFRNTEHDIVPGVNYEAGMQMKYYQRFNDG
jgi:hypothetical protein